MRAAFCTALALLAAGGVPAARGTSDATEIYVCDADSNVFGCPPEIGWGKKKRVVTNIWDSPGLLLQPTRTEFIVDRLNCLDEGSQLGPKIMPWATAPTFSDAYTMTASRMLADSESPVVSCKPELIHIYYTYMFLYISSTAHVYSSHATPFLHSSNRCTWRDHHDYSKGREAYPPAVLSGCRACRALKHEVSRATPPRQRREWGKSRRVEPSDIGRLPFSLPDDLWKENGTALSGGPQAAHEPFPLSRPT